LGGRAVGQFRAEVLAGAIGLNTLAGEPRLCAHGRGRTAAGGGSRSIGFAFGRRWHYSDASL